MPESAILLGFRGAVERARRGRGGCGRQKPKKCLRLVLRQIRGGRAVRLSPYIRLSCRPGLRSSGDGGGCPRSAPRPSFSFSRCDPSHRRHPLIDAEGNVAEFKLRFGNWRGTGQTLYIWRRSVWITDGQQRIHRRSDRIGTDLITMRNLVADVTTITIPERYLGLPSTGNPIAVAQPAALAAGGVVGFKASAQNVLPCFLDVQFEPPPGVGAAWSKWYQGVDFKRSPFCPQPQFWNSVGELCLSM